MLFSFSLLSEAPIILIFVLLTLSYRLQFFSSLYFFFPLLLLDYLKVFHRSLILFLDWSTLLLIVSIEFFISFIKFFSSSIFFPKISLSLLNFSFCSHILFFNCLSVAHKFPQNSYAEFFWGEGVNFRSPCC